MGSGSCESTPRAKARERGSATDPSASQESPVARPDLNRKLTGSRSPYAWGQRTRVSTSLVSPVSQRGESWPQLPLEPGRIRESPTSAALFSCPRLGPAHHHVEVAAPAPRAHQPLAPIRHSHLG